MAGVTPTALDEMDRKLVDTLRTQGRASIRELSRRTRMRPSTVHSRLRRLVSRGVIEHFTVKLNPAAVGESLAVFVLVTSEGTIPPAAFRDPRVKEVFGITGEYDLLLKIKVSSLEDFNSFILSFRERPQVKRTHTLVGTIGLKEEL